MSERLLVLVRHGQSEWNLKNLFTGWRDVDLTEQGVKEARDAGRKGGIASHRRRREQQGGGSDDMSASPSEQFVAMDRSGME